MKVRAIETLHGLIHVERIEQPPYLVLASCCHGSEKEFGIETFVCMSVLPKDLQAKIKEELKKLPKMSLTHAATSKEWRANKEEVESEMKRRGITGESQSQGEDS